MKKQLIVLCILLGGGFGCVAHITPYEKKVREYEVEQYAATNDRREMGSLWSDASARLFEDARARRVGDILTIQIDERADATRDANTNTSNSNEIDLGVSSFLTAMSQLAQKNSSLDPGALVSAMSESKFNGGGSTTRSGELRATLPVRIKRLLPNGDLYVEGNKVLLLNDEESHLYISGVVRPVDISPSNAVSSSVIADVELEYTGRGVIADKQRPGWFSRFLDFIWPF